MTAAAADDHWVTAAMSDDAMVVDLLVSLHSSAAPPPPPPAVALPLDWSVRQRRSKPLSSSVVASTQKNQAHQRASPTTPLSWSGATSISGGSGGAGGEESSSRPLARKPSSGTRSKVNGDGGKTASKRSRKKKTLAELQVLENSLQKEKRELKREIAALHVNLEEQRTTNEKLKRMKLEFEPLPSRETSVAEESTSDQPKDKTTEACCTTSPNVSSNAAPSSKDGPELKKGTASNPKFVLPDLNIPFEETSCPNVIWSRANYA